MAETLGQAQVEVTANLTDWQRSLAVIRQDWDKNFQQLVRTAQSSLGQVSNVFKGLATGVAGLGIGVVIEGITGDLKSMALEADKATIATRVFSATIKAAGLDASAADKMVNTLSERFRVMPEQVKDAVAIMARMGLSLEDIEKGLVTAGSSAVIAGADIGDSFQRASIAFTAGRSELLDSLGVVVNASDAWKEYAAEVGKTTQQLTPLQKAQAYINAAFKESVNEIQVAGTAFEGLTGRTAELENATMSLRKDIGDRFLPIVNAVTSAQLEWTKTFSSLIKDSQQLGTVLGGVSGALVGLTTIAGGAALKTALASIGSMPALLAAAGASFGVFATGGAAFGAVVGLGAVVGNLVGEINKVNAAIEDQAEAWRKLEEEKGIRGAIARMSSAKQQLDVLRRTQAEFERENGALLREAQALMQQPRVGNTLRLSDGSFTSVQTINDLLRQQADLTTRVTEASRRLAVAETELTRARAEAAKPQADTNKNNEQLRDSIEDQIRALIRLKATGQDVSEQLKPLFKAYEKAGGDVAALRIELEKFENELERNAKAAEKVAAANKKAAEEQARLNDARREFLDNIRQEDNLQNLGNQVQGMSSRELRAKFENIEAEQQLAISRVKAAKTLEQYAAASAAYEVATSRLAVVQDEINKRVAEGARVMEGLRLDTSGATQAIGTLTPAVADFARTLASVERDRGAFTSFGDAVNKLLASGVPLTSGLLKELEERFKGVVTPARDLGNVFDDLARVEDLEGNLNGVIQSLESFSVDDLEAALKALGETTLDPALLKQIKELTKELKRLRDAALAAAEANRRAAEEDAYLLDAESKERIANAAAIKAENDALEAQRRLRDSNLSAEDVYLLDAENKERVERAAAIKAENDALEAQRRLRDSNLSAEDVALLDAENKERVARAAAVAAENAALEAQRRLRDANAATEDAALIDAENKERIANAKAIEAQNAALIAQAALRDRNLSEEDIALLQAEHEERLRNIEHLAAENAALEEQSGIRERNTMQQLEYDEAAANAERVAQIKAENAALEAQNRLLAERQSLTFTGSDAGRAALSGATRVQRAGITGEQLSASELSAILADIEKALALPNSMTGLNADTRRILEGIVSNIKTQLAALEQAREDLRNAGASGGAASTLATQSQISQQYNLTQAELLAGLEGSADGIARSIRTLFESGSITLEQYNAMLEEQAKALDKIANNEQNLTEVRAEAARQAAALRAEIAGGTAKPSELGSAPDGQTGKPDELGGLGVLAPKSLAEIRAEVELLSAEYKAGLISAAAYAAGLQNQNVQLQQLIDSGQLSTEEQRRAKLQIKANSDALEDLTSITKIQAEAVAELEIKEQLLRAERERAIQQYNELRAQIQSIIGLTKDLVGLITSAANGASASSITSQIGGLAQGIADFVGQPIIGDILGAIGDIGSALIDFFTAPQREAEALKKQIAGLTDGFKFFGQELAITKTQSRGWLGDLLLGQQTVLDEVATELNTRLASSLEDAVTTGIGNGFSAALETGDWNKFLENMNLELRNYLVKSFIDAFISSESTKAILKPALDAALAAAKTPDVADDLAAADALAAAYAQLGESFKPLYDALKPVYDALTPSTNLPQQQMQDVLNRPGVAVAVGGFAQAAAIAQFEASITYFGGHVTRFGEIYTRVEGFYGRLLSQGIRVVTESLPSSGLAADLRGI